MFLTLSVCVFAKYWKPKVIHFHVGLEQIVTPAQPYLRNLLPHGNSQEFSIARSPWQPWEWLPAVLKGSCLVQEADVY